MDLKVLRARNQQFNNFFVPLLSKVMDDILEVAPELSDPFKLDEAVKEATREALHYLYATELAMHKTEREVGWTICCVLWRMYHEKLNDNKCPIINQRPAFVPGEPDSAVWGYYMQARYEAEEDFAEQAGRNYMLSRYAAKEARTQKMVKQQTVDKQTGQATTNDNDNNNNNNNRPAIRKQPGPPHRAGPIPAQIIIDSGTDEKKLVLRLQPSTTSTTWLETTESPTRAESLFHYLEECLQAFDPHKNHNLRFARLWGLPTVEVREHVGKASESIKEADKRNGEASEMAKRTDKPTEESTKGTAPQRDDEDDAYEADVEGQSSVSDRRRHRQKRKSSQDGDVIEEQQEPREQDSGPAKRQKH